MKGVFLSGEWPQIAADWLSFNKRKQTATDLKCVGITEHTIITVNWSIEPRHRSHHRALDKALFRDFAWNSEYFMASNGKILLNSYTVPLPDLFPPWEASHLSSAQLTTPLSVCPTLQS